MNAPLTRDELLRARIVQAQLDADSIATTLLGGANSPSIEASARAETWMRSVEYHLAEAKDSLDYLERALRQPAKAAA